MTKTNEELYRIKEEYETLTKKLVELSEDELMQVTGGSFSDWIKKLGERIRNIPNVPTKSVVAQIISPEDKLGGKIASLTGNDDNK